MLLPRIGYCPWSLCPPGSLPSGTPRGFIPILIEYLFALGEQVKEIMEAYRARKLLYTYELQDNRILLDVPTVLDPANPARRIAACEHRGPAAVNFLSLLDKIKQA
jgi:hypothetical protein